MSDLDRIKALAGLATDTVAEAGCDCECGQSPCEACGEDHHEVAEAVGDAAEVFYNMQDAFAGGEAEGAHKVIIDELVRYLSGDQLEDFVADFSRHYDLADMDMNEDDLDENAFNQAAAAAKRAGKEEFEFNGKKYKTTMDKSTAHQLDDDVQFEAEDDEDEDYIEPFSDDDYDEFGVRKSTSFNTPPKKKNESEESDEEVLEEISEAPTMDTTQLVNIMRNAGMNEEAIAQKLDEWANTPEGVGEIEPTVHGGDDNYAFAQSVNLSLKKYLDAEDMKVQVSEHTVEDMKALYESKKNK